MFWSAALPLSLVLWCHLLNAAFDRHCDDHLSPTNIINTSDYFPPILTIKHNLTAVLFKGCQDPLIFIPDLEPECIFTAKRLAKVAWKPVQNRAPELFNFIENFSFEYPEYIELLESYINTSDTTTPIKHTNYVYHLQTLAIFVYSFNVPSGQFDAMLQVGDAIRNPAVLDRPDPRHIAQLGWPLAGIISNLVMGMIHRVST